GDLRLRRLAPHGRQVVGDKPAAPGVLRLEPVAALPEQQRDQRAAHLLAGVEQEPGQLLAGEHALDIALLLTGLEAPLSRPADRDGHATVAAFEVEVREDAVRTAS